MTERKFGTITTMDGRDLIPIRLDSRIAMSVMWFTKESEANEAGKIITEQGNYYNGGWYHGMLCGRETRFDYVNEQNVQLYAVTF